MKTNGTLPEFENIKSIPCSEIIENSKIILSSMIKISFLDELKGKSVPTTRSLAENSDSESPLTAGPGCESGCTTSAVWNCGYNCGGALYYCYTAPWSNQCFKNLKACTYGGAWRDCCYCGAYVKAIDCYYC